MTSVDFYKILQISPLADPDVVSAAYRALAKRAHPDSGYRGGDDEMRKLNEAVSVLRSPLKRAAYDLARNARIKSLALPSRFDHPEANGRSLVASEAARGATEGQLRGALARIIQVEQELATANKRVLESATSLQQAEEHNRGLGLLVEPRRPPQAVSVLNFEDALEARRRRLAVVP